MNSQKIIITTDTGEKVEASAPVIISASRSTDIPAFYSEWLLNRIRKGYCVWINPFNQQKHYISFCNCKVIVFWTKNPAPIIPYLPILDEMGIHYYFQFTLNDYEKEGFEPNIPSLENRIATFKNLSKLIGTEKVIWRFDPIILSHATPPRTILTKAWNIGNKLQGCTNKLVFSFVDILTYRKVQNNLIKETGIFDKENIETAEGTEIQKEEIASGLSKLRDIWHERGWNISLATCAEDIDLSKFNIEHNRCIDGELLSKLFHYDKELLYYLHTGNLPEPNLFGSTPEIPQKAKSLKDKGQRKACGCIISKDIGMYNTCRHFCVYCYANTSRKVVSGNEQRHISDNECLLSIE